MNSRWAGVAFGLLIGWGSAPVPAHAGYCDGGDCSNFGNYCGAGDVRRFESFRPPTIPNPPLVWTCVKVAYPADSAGNPVGPIDAKTQECCQTPSYARLKDDADLCACQPQACLSMYFIESGATAAISLNQALNLGWQHLKGETPSVLNSPVAVPSGTPAVRAPAQSLPVSGGSSSAASAGTVSSGAASASLELLSPDLAKSSEAYFTLIPVQANLFNAIHQTYQRLLKK